MKKIAMSLIVLGVLLGNAHEAKAQEYITKTIDTFNVVQPIEDNSVTCDPLLGMLVPFPCLLVTFGDGTTNAMSQEMGLDTNEVIGGSRGMTLTYDGTGVTGPIAILSLIPPPDDIGALSLDNEDDVFSTANVKWDGEGAGLPDFDMSSYESQLAYYNEFVLGAFFVDINTNITIEVTNFNNETVRLTKVVVNPIGANVEDIIFSLNDPGWVGNRGIFGQKIQSIALILSGDNTFDANIDYVYLRKIIPEPSLVWGTVVALGTGMISTNRKRKFL